ncbi:MAG: M56 family metallopeptidase [Aeromicrobium sp.]
MGARWLRGAAWTRRAPGLGILTWQALTASVVLSVVLAGIALAMPKLPGSSSLAVLMRACVDGLRAQYGTPAGAALSIAGGLLAAVIFIRVTCCVLASLVTMRRDRQAQRQHLMMASRLHPLLGVQVVDHGKPAVYCVPGKDGTVVFTSAALLALDDNQIRMVIAHERAHLSGRHDLVLALAGALRRALPFVGSMKVARDEMGQLVEMRADDVAMRLGDRISIAKALVHLAEGPIPSGALGAGGAALARLTRIAEPPRPIGAAERLLGVGAALLMLIGPFAIAVEPAFAAAAMHYCPLLPAS